MKDQLRAIVIQIPIMGLLAGCAISPAIKTDDIPAPLRVSTKAVLTQRTHAAGVQIYLCRADKDGAARFEWVLKEPEADLFDHAGNTIGKHYAGPTWEAIRLARYKVPKRVLLVDELPRNAMGKVQKNVLRTAYASLYGAGSVD